MFKGFVTVGFFLSLFGFMPCIVLAQSDSITHNLDYYTDAAVKNSPLLKDYGNQILASRLDSLTIKAQNRPQVNGNVSALYEPNYGNFGYDQPITNGGNYAAQIAATQNILNSKILKPQYRQVNIQGQTIANTSKLSEHDLRHNVVSQYLSVWSDKSQLSNALQVRKLLDEEENVLKPLVEQGILKQSSYLAFHLERESDELNLKQLRMQFAIDLMTLNILCGINDTVTAVKLQEPSLKRTDIQYNYFKSNYFQQYYIDSLQITNQKELTDVRYKPHFAWNADAGFLSSTPLFYMHPGFSLGLSLVVPIFDGKQRDIDYQRFGIQERTRLDYVFYNHNQYDKQFAMLSNQLVAVEELTRNLKTQLGLSDQLIGMNKSELNRGDISITDFIMNLRSDIDIRSSLSQNQVKEWQIINDLNYYNW